MTRAEIAEALMTGKVDGVCKQDLDELYPKMPGVAQQVWENVQELQKKRATTRQQLEMPQRHGCGMCGGTMKPSGFCDRCGSLVCG